MRRIISMLVENESGTLSRVAGLFSARGYNIDSLTVSPTEDPSLSRMTVVTAGSDDVIEQITKQCNKLIEVFKVQDITETNYIERELMLLKVKATNITQREEITRLVSIFRARIIDVCETSYVIEVTGDHQKIESFLEIVASSSAIIETVRTGVCGIGRGDLRIHAKKS